jgi:outer membrane protein OmpA-like peptidoglycan-associated protein
MGAASSPTAPFDTVVFVLHCSPTMSSIVRPVPSSLRSASPLLRSSALAVALLAGLTIGATTGCHGKEPKSPDARLDEVNPPQNPDLGRYPARVSIDILSLYLTDNVRTVCAGSAPFFEYDSAKVETEDKGSMNNLAQCMKIGPLQGKSIRLTGRTDPRGTEEYNEQLGLERAERVKKYLVGRGIEASRIRVTSLGKTDASPFPRDWQGDRRVQIDLAE